jgi:hypothetical protein
MSRPLFRLLIIAALGGASPATADYMISFSNGGAPLPEVNSATGFRRDVTLVLAQSNGDGILTGSAYAGPGYVAPYARIDCTWWGGFSGAFSGKTRARMSTNDFIVTGPAGPSSVPGTIQLRVRLALDRTGGYANNNGHLATFSVNASTLYSGVQGSLSYGNFNLFGSGCFAGVSSPNVDMIVPLTGNYPVNVPFSITIDTEAPVATYGNATVNPGMTVSDGGGAPGAPNGRGLQLETGGPVMLLPAGYTLNSASWSVVNNIYARPVAVDGTPPVGTMALGLAGANPSSGPSRLSLALPRDGNVRVVVHDVTGRAVRTLRDGWTEAGMHEVVWDGRDASGGTVRAGIYFVRADAGGARVTRSLVRIR